MPKQIINEPNQANLEAMLASNCPIIVCFSGGKDSIAMVLTLLERGIAKERIVLHHQNVDGESRAWFDWPITRSYCQAFARAFGLTYLEQYRAGGIMGEATKENAQSGGTYYQEEQGGAFLHLESKAKVGTRLKYPMVCGDMQKRWCSSVAKMEPHHRALRALYPIGGEVKQLIVCTGERWQESKQRSKYKALQWHKVNAKERQVLQWRPLVSWPEGRVWQIIKRHQVQPHPCYVLGWGRASCMTCIFNSANHWRTLLEIAPERVKGMHTKELEFNHTLYQQETIMERALRGQSLLEALPDQVREEWLPVALGTEFTKEIITDNWQLPAGAYSAQACGAV